MKVKPSATSEPARAVPRRRLDVVVRSRASSVLGLLGVWLTAGVWFYQRFPNNLHDANFYAEDGRDFTVAFERDGIFPALFLDFNGYYVLGVQLLSLTASAVNEAIFTGRLFDQPQSIALVSYGFLGLCSVAPVAALGSWLSLPYKLAVAAGVALVPMRGFDYAIVGTLGNLKYAFLWLALLALLHRMRTRKRWALIVCDAVIVVCAYTTLTVYLLVPVLAWVVLRPALRSSSSGGRSILPTTSRQWSALVALMALAPLPIKILVQGVADLPGYLDEPFRWSSAVELLLSRSLLHPLTHAAYGALNDVIALVMTLGLLALALRCRELPVRAVALGLLVLPPAATALFAAGRPGVSRLFADYGDTGPDQFFYAQNFIAVLLFALLLQEYAPRALAAARLRKPVRPTLLAASASLALVAVWAVGPTESLGSFGGHDFMERDVGQFDDVARSACLRPGTTVTVPIYPAAGWTITADRAELCDVATAASPRPLGGQ